MYMHVQTCRKSSSVPSSDSRVSASETVGADEPYHAASTPSANGTEQPSTTPGKVMVSITPTVRHASLVTSTGDQPKPAGIH